MSSTDLLPPRTLKRANEAIEPGVVAPPLLFDEFWRESELALLFGPAGVGKSLLAVGLADALARGRPIDGLRMPTSRRNVLYVDLVMSDTQFGLRYACEGSTDKLRRYKFSANLFRDRPASGVDLAEWLGSVVVEEKIRVVVIDDLSVIAQSEDGTRQTLELMRSLRSMTHKLGISVLVLADSHPFVFSKDITERDLRRTRILCTHADSVFAISSVGDSTMRHLVQTRSQASDLAWTHRSPAHFRLVAHDDGFVGFDFVEPAITPEQRHLICEIKRMRLDKMTFRAIAERLGLSKSTVARLYAKWTTALSSEHFRDIVQREMERKASAAQSIAHDEELEDETLVEDRYDFEDLLEPDGPQESLDERPVAISTLDPARIPFAAALGRRLISDLPLDYDHNGVEIFVESREEHSGKPKVWYRLQPGSGNYTRYVRDSFGTSGTTLGPSPYLPRDREIMLVANGRSPPQRIDTVSRVVSCG